MAYNLGSLATEVHRHLGFHPRYTTALLWEAVNKGQEEVAKFCRNIKDFWYINTFLDSGGTNYQMEYVFAPMVVLEVHSATVDGKPLQPMTLEEWNNTYAEDSTGTGEPTHYIIFDSTTNGKSIALWPRPGQVYKIQCVVTAIPDEMDETTDVPVIPRSSKDSMVLYAAYWCLRTSPSLEDQNRAMFFYNLYLKQRGDDKSALRVNEVIKTQRRR